MEKFRLSPEQLAWRCDPAQFDFESTEQLPSLEGTIGQNRALSAIEFGLGIRENGFNIFVLGEPGTGRSSTIQKILGKRARNEPTADDWCYIQDFEDGTQPVHIRLPAGCGRELHRDVEILVSRLEEEIPKIFESKEYEQRKTQIAEEHQESTQSIFKELEEEANRKGFTLQKTVSGLVLVPVKDEHPLSQKEYEDLSDEERSELDERGSKLKNRLNEAVRKVREREKEMRSATLQMEKDVLLYSIGHLFDELEEKYKDFETVTKHFENCKQDILDRIEEFRPSQGPQIMLPGMQGGGQEPSFDRYRVNLFVDNKDLEGAPVVYEANPTYFNLFGRIEHVIQMGNATTNFTMIKSGALHRANGGYLILDCREILINMFSYEALKRTIRNQEIKIEDMAEQYRLFATVSLKPKPVPLDCKIILIGTPFLYYLLYQYDQDFRKYFKVKSDFDRMMKNNSDNLQQYARFVATRCREENLLPVDREGVARLAEHSARLIEDKNKLSSRFIDISDIVREAAYYAEQENRSLVERSQIEKAIDAKTYRSNKLEERIQEAIEEGMIIVDVEGAVTGQVNGLAIYQSGDYSFGKPTRVTVRTYLGRGGVINIEREAKLSGPVHDKGVLILGGFFGERFAVDKPLSLAASIAFEQSYSGVEGDSASSTELYGLMSSLSGLPIRQGIAVTGSVNQHGRIQPIGGVNEKIEGFFAVCKFRGLTGEQGVIIPSINVKNLMLKEEVLQAVREGKFHVWSVDTADEGIEILTGVPAGEREDDGRWPDNSVNGRIDQRLTEMAEAARKFGKDKEKEGSS